MRKQGQLERSDTDYWRCLYFVCICIARVRANSNSTERSDADTRRPFNAHTHIHRYSDFRVFAVITYATSPDDNGGVLTYNAANAVPDASGGAGASGADNSQSSASGAAVVWPPTDKFIMGTNSENCFGG
jgi:hypothetical protein